ncbi:MAG: hypothetical protein HY721_31745 [Planctomycetes bacterium]|nr:hypothetical protein [Planctomycetota bacterium]
MRPPLWRVASEYVGAGKFIVLPERLLVGTEYGVQCVSRRPAPAKAVPKSQAGAPLWKASLGSRCVGLMAWENHAVIAACVKGLFVLSETGEQRWGTHSLKDLVHAPVPFRDGILMTTTTSIHYIEEWNGPKWRFDFPELLGTSVEQIRLVNLFELDGHIVAGAVDYDSGIGRVLVLDGSTGRKQWASDPGPISDLFPAGQAVFVWCQTGYGKFETRMTRLDGHEIWQRDFAGLGTVRPDGSLAMVVGSNESPTWDDWEYRQVSPTGKVELALKGTGRCPVRPLVRKDGAVYFLGSVLPMDLGGSRVDYTSFFAMPQEVLYQHLMGIRTQLPEYDVTLHRLRSGEDALEVIYQVSGSFSFADLQLLPRPASHGPHPHGGSPGQPAPDEAGEVVLCDGQDIIAVEG